MLSYFAEIMYVCVIGFVIKAENDQRIVEAANCNWWPFPVNTIYK